MITLIATMRESGYIIITLVLMLFSAGVIALLAWLTIRERKRFRESRSSNKAIKMVNFDKELKSRVVTAKAKTKFTMIAILVEDVISLSAEYGASSVENILEVVCRRVEKFIHVPMVATRHSRDRVVFFINGNIPQNSLAKMMPKLFEALSAPIAMPNAKQVLLEYNIASVYYPGDGTEPVRLANCLDIALAESRRNGINFYRHYDKTFESDTQPDVYFEYCTGIKSRAIGVYYRMIFDVNNMKALAIECSLRYHKEENDGIVLIERASLTRDESWLGKILLERAIPQLKEINKSSETPKKLIYRLYGRQILDLTVATSLAKELTNHQVPTDNLKVVIDYRQLRATADKGKSIIDSYRKLGIHVMASHVNMDTTAAELISLGIGSVEIVGKLLVDAKAQGVNVADYMSRLENNGITVLASNVDTNEMLSDIKTFNISQVLGEVTSKFLTVKDVLGG